MNNLCFNRFTLRTDDAKTRRKILRWLALNYRLYEYLPSEAEIRGRFISRKPFPAEALRRQIGETARRQDSVPADCLYGLILALCGR